MAGSKQLDVLFLTRSRSCACLPDGAGMPAKTPIYLKASSNSSSKWGKKFRLRDILSPDMISPPLGDFRHTIHIGSGGEHDVFGDISFLQGKYELLPGNQGQPRAIHSEFSRANSTPNPTFPDAPSPVLKNAISLPSVGGSQALNLPLLSSFTIVSQSRRGTPAPPKPPRLQTDGEQEPGERWDNGDTITEGRGEPMVPHNSSKRSHGHSCQTVHCRPAGGDPDPDPDPDPGPHGVSRSAKPPEDSLINLTASFLSLHLDLGPSILEDVLDVMDRKPQLQVK